MATERRGDRPKRVCTRASRLSGIGNEYVYFIVMFIEMKKRTGAR